MMNDTNIDHLMQVTLRPADWHTASLGSGRDDRPAFDDHLAQASTPRAPSEPPRPRESRAPDSNPPGGRLPSQGEATRSEVEDNKDAAAAPPAADSTTQDDNKSPEETNCDSPAAENAQGEVAASSGTQKSGDEKPSTKESDDGSDEEVAEQAATAEATAAVVLFVAQLPQEKVVDGEASSLSNGQHETEKKAKEAPTQRVREATECPQPTKPIANQVTAEQVIQTESALPAAAGAAKSEPAETLRSNKPKQTETAHRTGKLADAAAPQNAKAERPASTSKRPRASDRDTESSSEHPTKVSKEDTQQADAVPRAEPKPNRAEKPVDETHDLADVRPTSGRHSQSSDSPNNTAKVAAAIASNAAIPDAPHEAGKPDATDESVRPAVSHGARSDALAHPLARLHRNGTAMARGGNEAKNEDVPRVDATRFVSRVAKAFHTAQERGGMLQLRLSPPELGALRIELAVQDGVLAAKLETETPAARRVLLDHLPVLRERLAEQNIRVEKFDVDVRQEGGGNSPPSPHEQRQQQPQQGSPHRQSSRQAVPVVESIAATPAAAGPTTDTQINLVA